MSVLNWLRYLCRETKSGRAEAVDVWYYNVDDDLDRLVSLVDPRITSRELNL